MNTVSPSPMFAPSLAAKLMVTIGKHRNSWWPIFSLCSWSRLKPLHPSSVFSSKARQHNCSQIVSLPLWCLELNVAEQWQRDHTEHIARKNKHILLAPLRHNWSTFVWRGYWWCFHKRWCSCLLFVLYIFQHHPLTMISTDFSSPHKCLIELRPLFHSIHLFIYFAAMMQTIISLFSLLFYYSFPYFAILPTEKSNPPAVYTQFKKKNKKPLRMARHHTDAHT